MDLAVGDLLVLAEGDIEPADARIEPLPFGRGVPLRLRNEVQLELAHAASSGRSSSTVYGGHEHQLRQTAIALTCGQTLDEHENPGEATVHVLHGRVRLAAGDTSCDGTTCLSSRTAAMPSKTPPCCSPWRNTRSCYRRRDGAGHTSAPVLNNIKEPAERRVGLSVHLPGVALDNKVETVEPR